MESKLDLIRLQELHQLLKLDYLEQAQKNRYPDCGLGNEKNNQNTQNFLKEAKENHQEFFKKYAKIRESLRSFSNPEKNYAILRELYMISPSIHELWFFNSHFKFRIDSFLKGRLGLKVLLRARVKGYQPTHKGSITYLTKNCILLENQYSSEKIPSLLDTEPADDPCSSAKEILKISEKFEDPQKILESGIIEKIFSTVHGLLRKENYELLKSDKLASKEKWLYYAPCAINEGPLFLPKDGIRLTSLSSEVDLDNPRKKLSEHLWIWDYFLTKRNPKLILKKVQLQGKEYSIK